MAEEPTHLLVVDKAAGELLGIDLVTGVRAFAVPVGPGPHEVVAMPPSVSPTGGPAALVSIYAPPGGVGQVLALVDLNTREVVERIATSPQTRPHGLALVPGTATVVVTVEADDAVMIIDLSRPGSPAQVVPTGHRLPHMVVVLPDGSAAFAANIRGAAVTRVDLATLAVTSARVGAGAEGIAVNHDGSEVWVGSNEEHEVHVLAAGDLATLGVFSTCRVPIRVTPVGSRLMAVTCMEDSDVALYDVTSYENVGTVSLPTGSRPVGTLATEAGDRLFVAATATGTIYEVHVATRDVVRSFAAGTEPDGMALVRLGD